MVLTVLAPALRMFSFRSGSSAILINTSDIRWMIGSGVFAGAMIAFHVSTKFGRIASCTEGNSGRYGLRSSEVTASPRTVSARTCGRASVMLAKERSTSPATTAAVDNEPPLNGTCTILVPVRAWNSSTPKWVRPPAPLEP